MSGSRRTTDGKTAILLSVIVGQTGNAMCEGMPQEASDADDSHVRQLSERITHLRELIIVMVAQDRDTRRQSEKLFILLQELRAAKIMVAFRTAGSAPQADQGEPAQTVSSSNPRQHNA
jgi:hypothetical protein